MKRLTWVGMSLQLLQNLGLKFLKNAKTHAHLLFLASYAITHLTMVCLIWERLSMLCLYLFFTSLCLGPLKTTNVEIQLANRSRILSGHLVHESLPEVILITN